jgi:hypothetical protein
MQCPAKTAHTAVLPNINNNIGSWEVRIIKWREESMDGSLCNEAGVRRNPALGGFIMKAFANTSAGFCDQSGVENVMAANLLIATEFWCDGIFLPETRMNSGGFRCDGAWEVSALALSYSANGAFYAVKFSANQREGGAKQNCRLFTASQRCSRRFPTHSAVAAAATGDTSGDRATAPALSTQTPAGRAPATVPSATGMARSRLPPRRPASSS